MLTTARYGKHWKLSALPVPTSPEDEKVNTEETIMSAYIMQTIDRDWGNIILGLRIEDTEYDTVGQQARRCS